MGQVISLLVVNEAGVLSRIVGLFSQRGYNIESLNVAPALDAEVSRITLTTRTDLKGTEQVVKQLNKLIDVVKVTPYDSDIQVIREMALVRVQISQETRAEVLALAEVAHARIIDHSPRHYIFELTGHSREIDTFLEDVQAYGISELHRTGELTLGRGMTSKLKGASDIKGPNSQ